MQEQLFLPASEAWIPIRDGNATARAIYHRHYSRRRYADGRDPMKFIGPGEYLALLSSSSDALFVWRKFIDDSGQRGINCAVFRNEGSLRSSDLILDADRLAFARWPGERHYTYVNAKRIRSTNPGYCFLAAGWLRCGTTRNGLHILERLP